MFKNILRKFKRYDLEDMKGLQTIAKVLKNNIDRFYDKSTLPENKTGIAVAIMFNMSCIETDYPLETYVAIYSIYEKELKEVIEYLNSIDIVF